MHSRARPPWTYAYPNVTPPPAAQALEDAAAAQVHSMRGTALGALRRERPASEMLLPLESPFTVDVHGAAFVVLTRTIERVRARCLLLDLI